MRVSLYSKTVYPTAGVGSGAGDSQSMWCSDSQEIELMWSMPFPVLCMLMQSAVGMFWVIKEVERGGGIIAWMVAVGVR